jgi:hypothetical protein
MEGDGDALAIHTQHSAGNRKTRNESLMSALSQLKCFYNTHGFELLFDASPVQIANDSPGVLLLG